jgi:hypothetical protein
MTIICLNGRGQRRRKFMAKVFLYADLLRLPIIAKITAIIAAYGLKM